MAVDTGAQHWGSNESLRPDPQVEGRGVERERERGREGGREREKEIKRERERNR